MIDGSARASKTTNLTTHSFENSHQAEHVIYLQHQPSRSTTVTMRLFCILVTVVAATCHAEDKALSSLIHPEPVVIKNATLNDGQSLRGLEETKDKIEEARWLGLSSDSYQKLYTLFVRVPFRRPQKWLYKKKKAMNDRWQLKQNQDLEAWVKEKGY